MSILKKIAISTLLVAGTITMGQTFAQASDTSWGLSLAPRSGWRAHWDNYDEKKSDGYENAYILASRIDNSPSLVARMVNSNGAVRSGRVAVTAGGVEYFKAPGTFEGDIALKGHEYTLEMYATKSVSSYSWASGTWCAD